jgi:hypothetical protein
MTAMISDSPLEAGGRTKPRERPGGAASPARTCGRTAVITRATGFTRVSG